MNIRTRATALATASALALGAPIAAPLATAGAAPATTAKAKKHCVKFKTIKKKGKKPYKRCTKYSK